MLKTHYVEDLNKKITGEKVTLCGWVHLRRDHGKIVFVDLRDSTGICQIVILPNNKNLENIISKIGSEDVLRIFGTVNERPDNMKNTKISSGDIEILAEKIEIISKAKNPPFEISKNTLGINEETRLKYRYLDLRNQRMRKNLKKRNQALLFIRNYLAKKGFTEIQTPILSKSTPEGARDYLVPSRLHKGKFFALPQSPQQYKQLLMIAGIEKYFQIAPCFRDEDARANRSPGDFYQLDMEMSFFEQKDILDLVETMLSEMIAKYFPNKKITQKPWPKITYEDAMEKYPTDSPDLRKDKKDINELAFAWIVDFPLFQKQKKDDYFYGAGEKLAPSHHMFTAPKNEDIKELLEGDPTKVKSLQHDLVLNGLEVGGGSIRIHDSKIQEKVFDIIGFTKKDKVQFKHLLKAFEYGVPPHGGIAPGIERMLMILLGEKSLKEVMAFPLTGDGRDPMMESPSEVDKEQLKELGIKI
jgi:aspartyl-tRNA synthetase